MLMQPLCDPFNLMINLAVSNALHEPGFLNQPYKSNVFRSRPFKVTLNSSVTKYSRMFSMVFVRRS